MKQSTLAVILLSLLCSFLPVPKASAVIDSLVASNSVWKYLDNGSDQGTNWITPSFNDTTWKTGAAELGYGDAPGRPEATVVDDNPTPGFNSGDPDKYITTYFRQTFNVATPGIYSVVQMRCIRDDGIVVYLNGKEIFRNNMPGGTIDFTTRAFNAGDDGQLLLTTNVPLSYLQGGVNVIAAEIHQDRPDSSDISFALELTGNTQNNPPTVTLMNPGNGAFYTAPASIAISASASDPENNLTLVEFYNGTTKLGEDSTAPYTFDWASVGVGNYQLRAIATDALNAKGTSSVVNVTVGVSTPPTVANKVPAPGAASILTNIVVTFSEGVSGVDASDLLVNGLPALSVSGSGTTYTFTVPQQPEGTVFIGWQSSHGITDFENPPKAFDPQSAGATWQYTLTDNVAPVVRLLDPPAGSVLRALDQVEVTFSEPVIGVNAADIRVNGIFATSVSGMGAGPYRFEFTQPANGTITFSWAAGHGITDQSAARNAFSGSSWSYTLNTNLVFDGQIVINEIMYHPSSELVNDEWIELHNRGASAVNLTGWKLNRAVEFTFPNVTIAPGGYLVIAANVAAFTAKYQGSTAIGGWTGRLSNSRDEIELEDASGDRVDIVEYADEGDWSVRTWINGIGWEWTSLADGLGSSLELRQRALDNNVGQNWQASTTPQGTPGAANSVATANLAPLILDVNHFPAVPRSTNAVTITARIVDEAASGLTVRLWYRDGTTLPAFVSTNMLDNGLRNDGVAGDGLYGVVLPARANQSITEYYIEALDAGSNTRTWPAAVDTGGGVFGQDANALFQVSDEVYAGKQPLYFLIQRQQDQDGLVINVDRIQRNASFITVEGSDVQVRHNCYVRRRGASSFGSSPPTMKLSIPTDRMWNDKSSMNLNSVAPHAQVLGSAIALKAGLPAPYTRAVQLRFNGVNRMGGFGSYAHVEAFNSEWARDHYPGDGNGNAYSKRRPLCNFEYLGTDPQSYIGCAYEKESNSSENDWTDLVNLFFALDPDTTPANDYVTAVKRNVNVEQWMRYFAVLFLMNYTETALANGVDDDFDLYRGVVDPRFLLLPHDFDQIFGSSSSEPTTPNDIFLAANLPNVSRFLHHPEFEPLFLEEYRRQLAGTFSTNQLFPLFDQVLGDFVSGPTIQNMKASALARINYVAGAVPAAPTVVRASVTGEPDSPTYLTTAALSVGGTDITHYRYRLDGGAWSADRTVAQAISLSGLANGYHTVYVVGRNSSGTWQADADATASKTWLVSSALRGIVINEVLARNDSAVSHEGTTPDYIEFFNAGAATIDLGGYRLTDDLDDPNKFTFPANTTVASGAYRVVFANDPDGTSGIHIGFGLGQNGDNIYLLDRLTNSSRVIDVVKFGFQLSNRSIGRLSNGQWGLCVPTMSNANSSLPTGTPYSLKINEWLASPGGPFVTDFIELYNPTALPVNLGETYLSDQPIGFPTKHQITPLSFIDAFGYRAFLADNDPSAGADHLDFSLSAETGEIALHSASRALIDCVVYGQQFAGVSQGRSPNGGVRIVYLDTPTPGAGNPTAPAPQEPQIVTLVPLDAFWKYEESNVYPGPAWPTTSFVDGAWPTGQAAFGFDGNLNPLEPIRTPLTVAQEKTTYYFRTHFSLPAGLTPSSLRAVHLTDDGAVFYINGAEAGRFNMPAAPAAIGHDTPSSSNGEASSFQNTTLDQSALVTGDNVIAVELHQSTNQRSDIFFALRLEALVITNNPATAGIKINEVMANARNTTNSDGTVSDWVELYNPSNGSIDLTGMSLSDKPDASQRWFFPPGSIIQPNNYRVVRFDSGAPATTNFSAVLNTGFGLKASGDGVYLFATLQSGGELLDSVTFGIQAADWSIGRVPNGSSNWVLNLPSQNAQNLATAMGSPYALKINEWMAAPASGDDWFEIYNPNPQPVEISGLHLTDDLINRLQYAALPARSYMAAGLSGFLKIVADDNAAAGADHAPFALARGGDSLGIVDGFGTLIDSYTFGSQTTGVSQGRLPDGTANIISFPTTPTPEESNYLPIPNVVINEVLTHTDVPLEDAIELRNTNSTPVNISGWYLSDSRDALRKYRIPNNTTINGFSFKVFYETQFNAILGDPNSFSLSSAKGDQVYLSAVDAQGQLNGLRTAVDFGPAANGVSFGRHITSALNGNKVEFVAMSQRTFGVDNPPTVDDFRTGTGKTNSGPLVGPIVISEFMYHPPDLFGGVDDLANEYIELRNITAAPVPLYDPANPGNVWKLKDAVSFNFPPNTTIPANGVVLVVSFNPADSAALTAFRTKYNVQAGAVILGPYLGKLDNASDSIELARPDAPQTTGPDLGLVPYILVDKVKYSDVAPWPLNADGLGQSLNRTTLGNYGNDPANWTAASPSPGPQGANPDSDGDGMDDSWETTYFGNLSRNGSGDFDTDGMTDLQEFRAGTLPNSAGSVLRLRVLSMNPTVQLQFDAAANRSYVVEYLSVLGSTSWTTVQTVPADVARTVTVPAGSPLTNRFFRVRTP